LREFACLLILLPAFLAGCGTPQSRANGKQLIVLGVDGMDPGFVERHWADLPNLARMRAHGSFSRLATTTPPQSPTAWSTFITGLDASAHGIFDFVHRDPATMQPFLSMSETTRPRFSIPLGPYELPLVRSQVVLLRKGKAFWQTLGEHGIPATIVHMPVNYPPVDSGEGLAGMGTPDLRGTQGTFSYFTDDPGDMPRPVSGGVILRAEVAGGRAVLRLKGPPNTLRLDQRAAAIKLIVDVDPVQPLARLSIGDSVAIVREGEWSDWLAADFPLVPYLVSVRGMVRVFAKQLHPRFEIYVSPVNADPSSPDLPVSTPSSFSRDISKRIGRFYTLGIPEDTSAMRQGVFDLPEFLSQSRLVLADELKLLDDSLDRFRDGLLFFYFSSVDQNSHMLWGQHEAELLKIYRGVDAAIGEVLRRKPSAELMVMSDHGFASFDRWVDLNHWLHEEKLLALKPASRNESPEIDWERTKAYALGLNGLYVNLKGRERWGRIPNGTLRHALMERIRTALLALRDPANGRAPIETVVATDVTGPNARIAPDLIVGYAPGYRVSWETGAGGLAGVTFGDNTDAWIADHCINAADVPGVLFTTSKAQPIEPALRDLPVSLLAFFDIAPEPGMTGHSIY
jgi:predicted AlkP superfamily phosphohydrolase/phosphomutase